RSANTTKPGPSGQAIPCTSFPARLTMPTMTGRNSSTTCWNGFCRNSDPGPPGRKDPVMKLLIVGLGSMGKRRARLARGLDKDIRIAGVDTAEARRDEAVNLGL